MSAMKINKSIIVKLKKYGITSSMYTTHNLGFLFNIKIFYNIIIIIYLKLNLYFLLDSIYL